jgi:hypothetical protein
MNAPEPQAWPAVAATAADVLAVHRGEITGPGADAIIASYFAPGPEPRYDTPRARAEAEAEAQL